MELLRSHGAAEAVWHRQSHGNVSPMSFGLGIKASCFQPACRRARVKRKSARRRTFFFWVLMADWMRRLQLHVGRVFYWLVRKTRNVLMTAAELRLDP